MKIHRAVECMKSMKIWVLSNLCAGGRVSTFYATLCELLSWLRRSWADESKRVHFFLLYQQNYFQFWIVKPLPPPKLLAQREHDCASSWFHLDDKVYCNKIMLEIIIHAPQRKVLKLLTSSHSLKLLSASLIFEAVKVEKWKNICIKWDFV